MKISLICAFLLTISAAVAADLIKVSPDRSSTLVVSHNQRGDPIVELRSGKTVHRLFYQDLNSLFAPKLAKAFNIPLNKINKISWPGVDSARWLSAEEVEIKGDDYVYYQGADESDVLDGRFTYRAVVSKIGRVKELTVAQTE